MCVGGPRGASVADDEPQTSTFFATAFVEAAVSVGTDSHGDLWPTRWADDDALYSANGDGRGFGEEQREDIVVNRITGDPESGIFGERLAAADQVAVIWGDRSKYNRKPTGIVCADGRLYLAVYELRTGPGAAEFNYVPNASISWSDDHGRTWLWVQSNWWVGNCCGDIAYSFNLRRLTLRPFTPQLPMNQPDSHENPSRTNDSITPIEKSALSGHGEHYNDGDPTRSEDRLAIRRTRTWTSGGSPGLSRT